MGAESFTDVVPQLSVDNINDAFHSACENAAYWHGHGGYTGTICEKPGFVEFTLSPPPSLHEAYFIADALCMSWGGKIEHLVVERFGDKASEASDLYNDKWGNAVAFRLDNGDFFFCGIASS